MVKRALAIAFCLLLFCNIASAKIIGDFSTDKTGLKTVTLEEAKVKDTNASSMPVSSNVSQPATKTESIPQSDVVSGWVTAGLNNWLKGLIGGMYGSFENNSAVNNQFGSPRGALYTAITYVPNPYEDPTIKGLFLNYNSLAIFFVCIFIFGEWANRRLASMKVTSSVFGEKDLSISKFFGGICMCGIALSANLIYMFSLQIIQALSQFAMSKVLDSIAPSPENLILYLMMAICDLTVFIFFIIRYYIIYAVAVLCTIIAVLLVPDFSRDFAKKSIDHIVRILLLQPVAIFFTCLGILTMKGLPTQLQPFGYIALTVFIFLICLYMLIGDFEFIKKGAKTVIAWGAAV
ncbi:MAG: hypothetical protein P4M12_10360 [Gammaproteobacteria bacterium]|nr:hypothetical protein [Gammaproteobacteria bacterium]